MKKLSSIIICGVLMSVSLGCSSLYFNDETCINALEQLDAGLFDGGNIENYNSWLEDYTHRIPIEINNSENPNTLTNYQILLGIDTLTLISDGNMQPDGDDIRFTDDDEITLIPFWIEAGIGTYNTTIWVSVPILPMMSTKYIYMYYGNNLVSSASSGDDTFLIFDHFEGTTLNATKWIKHEYDAKSTISVSGGNLIIFNDYPGTGLNSCTGACIVSNNTVNTDTNELVVEARIKSVDWADSTEGTKVGFTDSNTAFEPTYYGTPLHYASAALYYYSPTPRCRSVYMDDGTNSEKAFYEQLDDYRNNWYRVTCNYDYVNRDIYGTWIGPTTINLIKEGSVSNVIPNYIFLSGVTGGVPAAPDMTHYFDWVGVRTYSPIEPIINIGSSQTSPLVAHWPFDDGVGQYANDTSGNNNAGILGGTTGVESSDPTWTTGISGNALSFDGDDWVVLPSTIAPQMITLDAWIYLNDVYDQDGSAIICKETGSGLPSDFAWRLFVIGTYPFDPNAVPYQVAFDLSNQTNNARVLSDTVLQLNRWYYVAGTYDGSNASIYINGIEENRTAMSGNLNSAELPTSIGVLQGWDCQWFYGKIDEVSIWNRALSPTEIQEHYEETYHAELAAYWPFDEGVGQYANDKSGNNNNGTLGNTDNIENSDPDWVNGISGKALWFNGTDDYAKVPHDETLIITENITIEAWVKPEDVTGAHTIVRKGDNSYWLEIELSKVNGGFRSGGVVKEAIGTTTLTTQTWYYFTMVYNQESIKVYVNGYENGEFVYSGLIDDDLNPLSFGTKYTNMYYFSGIIDEVSIWNRALSPTEIQDHYEEIYHAELAAHWPFDEGVGQYTNDTSENDNDGTLMPNYPSNNPTWVNGISKYALEFDGVDDYTEVPNSPSLQLTTSGAVELWIKSSLKTGMIVNPAVILDKDYMNYSCGYTILFHPSTGLTALIGTGWGVGYVQLNASITDMEDSWKNIVLTWDGLTGKKLYVNGELVDSTTNTISAAAYTQPLYIGNAYARSYYSSGTIDEVSIWNRSLSLAEIQEHYTLMYQVHNVNTDERFLTIQSAIDDSQTLNGHTIEVGAGRYNEDVTVDKRLTIIGEDKNSTIIDGAGLGDVVCISVDWVNISGFTIMDSGSNLGDSGLNLDTVQNCHIFNNNVILNGMDGIHLDYSNFNTISGNNISGNSNGVYVTKFSTQNKIYHNTIINNTNQAYDDSINFWDNGYPSGGNYWGDYSGVDFFSGPNQTTPGSDGIGDTPYVITDSGGNSWLPNYTHRIPIEINNIGNPNTLTNYQILLKIDTFTLISEGNMQSDGDDIRFTDEDEITLIPFWIENGIATPNTIIWVKVPNIPAFSTKEIFMYFGNSSATGDSSGNNTFLLFDNFEGSALDTTKWTATSWAEGGSVTVNGGYIEIRANSRAGNSGSCRIVSKNIINGYAMRVKAREVQFGGTAYWELGGIATSWVSDQGASLGSVIRRAGTSKGLYTKPTGSGIWSTFAMNETTYSTYEITINGTNSYAYDEFGNLLGSTVNGESFTNLRAGAWTYAYGFDGDQNPTRISLDWIAVRDFASIEPLVQVGNTEEYNPSGAQDNYPLMMTIINGTLFTIPLSEGWNLISLPFIQSDESISKVLESISGKWDYIQVYNATNSDHWKTNATFKPNQLNDLNTLNHKIGFWINIIEPGVNLVVRGSEPVSTSIPLYAGWNLVGYPTLCTTMIIPDAFWGTSADRIEICDTNNPYHLREPCPTYKMKPGEGYWVHVPADTIWVVDW